MKKGISVARFIIFLLGLAILIAALFVLIPLPLRATGAGIEFMIFMVVIYCALFIPLVFQMFARNEADGYLVSGVIYYRGVIVFAVLSMGLQTLLLFGKAGLKVVIIGELVLLFILIIYCYLAYKTGEHIGRVRREEQQKRACLEEMKDRAFLLADKIRSAYPNSELTGRTDRIVEDLRYLSPSDNEKAVSDEEEMLRIINSLISSNLFDGGPDSEKVILRSLDEFSMIYRQRKQNIRE